MAGRTTTRRWTWNHAVFIRDGDAVRVHLNGKSEPEIATESSVDLRFVTDQWFFGGRSDNHSNWEGRLDEIAVCDRALSSEEIDKLSQ